MKKKFVGAFLGLAMMGLAGSAYAATTYGPDTVTVPSYGGNFYSNTHYASGPMQYAQVNWTSPSGVTIYGTVNDSQHNNISSETTLYTGSNTSVYSGVSAGTSICLMLETSLFQTSSPSVNFQWTP